MIMMRVGIFQISQQNKYIFTIYFIRQKGPVNCPEDRTVMNVRNIIIPTIHCSQVLWFDLSNYLHALNLFGGGQFLPATDIFLITPKKFLTINKYLSATFCENGEWISLQFVLNTRCENTILFGAKWFQN